jgi:hypothetical protein
MKNKFVSKIGFNIQISKSYIFERDQWDLNLADKWGQFIELNKVGPRGF